MSIIQEKRQEILDLASTRFTNFEPEDWTLEPVHYMEPRETSIEYGIWEAGLIPVMVRRQGGSIYAQVILYHYEDLVGGQECVLHNGVWERYPD
jgi:hypothetical protein